MDDCVFDCVPVSGAGLELAETNRHRHFGVFQNRKLTAVRCNPAGANPPRLRGYTDVVTMAVCVRHEQFPMSTIHQLTAGNWLTDRMHEHRSKSVALQSMFNTGACAPSLLRSYARSTSAYLRLARPDMKPP